MMMMMESSKSLLGGHFNFGYPPSSSPITHYFDHSSSSLSPSMQQQSQIYSLPPTPNSLTDLSPTASSSPVTSYYSATNELLSFATPSGNSNMMTFDQQHPVHHAHPQEQQYIGGDNHQSQQHQVAAQRHQQLSSSSPTATHASAGQATPTAPIALPIQHPQHHRNPFIGRSACVVCGDRARGCNFGYGILCLAHHQLRFGLLELTVAIPCFITFATFNRFYFIFFQSPILCFL